MSDYFTQYQNFIKPSWAPPEWVFGPVWTVLYVLIAISFGWVFYQFFKKRLSFCVTLPFFLNLVFNALFTPIQFGLKNNLLASLDILLVLFTLIWAMISIYPKSRWVARINIPYLTMGMFCDSAPAFNHHPEWILNKCYTSGATEFFGMNVKIEPSWKAVLADEFKKPYFKELTDFVRQEYQTKNIFPHPTNLFKAFELCPFDQVKVVILGQDPYHGPGQAQGLCFSVPDNIPIPPSLINIYKEIQSDLGYQPPNHGNLEHWARQGVFLLNATLTVVAHRAGSHQKKGWETFTDEVIRLISEKKEHVVFILWGAYAGNKAWMINEAKHLILKAPHPSPLSAHRGFFGSRPFSKANEFLEKFGMKRIDWCQNKMTSNQITNNK